MYRYSVYRFNCFWASEMSEVFTRDVVARNEEEATRKIEKHADELVKKGFDRMVIVGNPIVEIDYVI